MLNNIDCFRSVILVVSLELRHIGGVDWHFIHITPLKAPQDWLCCAFRGECKTRANVLPYEYRIGLSLCMSVASENRDSQVTTYSVNKFWLTP